MSELVLEKQERLPSGWTTTDLNTIGEIVTGNTPSKKRAEYYGDDFNFFKPTDLNNGYYVKDSSDKLSKKGMEIARMLPSKSILVTCIGATIGKTGFIRISGASNQQINSIIPNIDFIFPEYLYFLCISPQIQKIIIQNSSSTTLPILNKSKFKKITIPLPPLNEQKRIVAKIEELFSKLDSAKQILEKTKILLKQYRQSLLKSAFEGKLTIDWRNENNKIIKEENNIQHEIFIKLEDSKKQTHQENGTLHVSELFEIPDEWIWARFDNIAKIGQGGTPSTSIKEYWNGEIPWLRSGDVRNNFIKTANAFITKSGLQNSSTTLCPQGTVLLAMTGQGLTRGRSAILEIDACANQSVAHIANNKKYIFNKFLFYYLQSQYWKIRSVYKGSNQPGLNVSIIKQFEIPIPSVSEQRIIVQKIEEEFSLIENNERIIELSLKKIEGLRKSILKQDFEGKLVPQDPNDEPAEVLLQKIKQEKEQLIQKQKPSKKNGK